MNNVSDDAKGVKSTPGPWKVDLEVSANFYDDGDGRTETLLEIVNDDTSETSCYANGDANARLIAAAPDLLAALKDIVQFDAFDADALRRIARAAITKAEGR